MVGKRHLRWLRTRPERRPVARDALRGTAIALEAAAAEPPDMGFEYMPVHDPELEPRDEAVFLLQIAAEIEHALMVQYLFAAYSLDPSETESTDRLLQIAREEMGHLATMQNLLLLTGGPLSFEREHSQHLSAIYPFRFRLEPVSRPSLAKYVWAESPADWSVVDLSHWPEFNSIDALREHVRKEAEAANGGYPLNRVGGLFMQLKQLFELLDPDRDFVSDAHRFQARYEDWGFDPSAFPNTPGDKLIVMDTAAGSSNEVKERAIAAIVAIGQQGEGETVLPGERSHFMRFLGLYRKYFSTQPKVHPIPVNPNTTLPPQPDDPGLPGSQMDEFAMMEEQELVSGRILNERSRLWAQLFNQRYRLLLGFLQHFFLYDDGLNESETSDPIANYESNGDRTARGYLLIWTFNEMRRLRKLSRMLVTLPLREESELYRAAPPFELPYTLDLPVRDRSRWRTHLDALKAADRLIAEIRELPPDKNNPFLIDLEKLDALDTERLSELASGRPLPQPPQEFEKVVTILEEAVRGFDVPDDAPHENFWATRPRDQFLKFEIISGPLVDDVGWDPAQSVIHQVISRDPAGILRPMPYGRPQIPESRRDYIRDWIIGHAPSEGAPAYPRERDPLDVPPGPEPEPGEMTDSDNAMLELLKSKRSIAMFVHGNITANGATLSKLFVDEKYTAILDFLKNGRSVRPPQAGNRLVVPGKPEESALYLQITGDDGVMRGRFSADEAKVVHEWIANLSNG